MGEVWVPDGENDGKGKSEDRDWGSGLLVGDFSDGNKECLRLIRETQGKAEVC